MVKSFYWFLLIFSALLYAFSFLLSTYLWWLIFFFPVPLLYIICKQNLSFIHGYIWGVITFFLHTSGGIYVVSCMAHEAWLLGVMLGIGMVLYQALCPATLFWCATSIIGAFSVQGLIIRLCIWTIALIFFITWIDWYSLWIFGIKEGYPLMHPLIPLAQHPSLLVLLPIVGKVLLIGLFFLVPISCVLFLWYKNYSALLFFCVSFIPWLLCWVIGESEMLPLDWHCQIKSLPYMAYSTAKNPSVIIRVVGNQLKNIIVQHPETEIIIMPESAFNVSNFADFPELLCLWNKQCLGKPIHFIFGASRQCNDNYYNSLHWIYDGVLQGCFDKRHAMLISERLPSAIDNNFMRWAYFSCTPLVVISSNDRIKLSLLDTVAFVPYICSELFFNELPDDMYGNIPIIAIVNDIFFLESRFTAYIQQLLVLLARYRAIAWQRDIVYVSYAQALFIDRHGITKNINE